jgi:hypothetical protein
MQPVSLSAAPEKEGLSIPGQGNAGPEVSEGSSCFQNEQKQKVALLCNWALDPLSAFGLIPAWRLNRIQ